MTGSATARPRTYLPPATEQRREVIDFARILRTSEPSPGEQRTAQLVGPDGQKRDVPDEIFAVLVQVANALAQGSGVTVVPNQMTLTTQEAADFLGISRPTLVTYLERGEIPFSLVGRHRRVELKNVLAFSERQQSQTRASLAEITRTTQQMEPLLADVELPSLKRMSEFDD
ncbi:helix-turn-helix domain-containing protein [Paramicrobacterium fandaimingii]|uniref:helix-turn-helix domain-containing protein n=1 Tax=Paramicrobacterium fandaimingii TaxID=2708079 RepID=UPI0014214E54|nr:helix-turn-helix domain-containing protein [Microbacterium fandaimingii]